MRRQFCLCCLRCFWPPRGRNNCRCLSLVKWRLIKLDKGERNSYLTKTFWCFESAFIRGDWVVRFLCKVLRHVTCTLHKRIGSGHSLTSIWDFERFPNKFWQQFAQARFFYARMCCVEWDGKVEGRAVSPRENRGVRVRDWKARLRKCQVGDTVCWVYWRWQDSIFGIDSTVCWFLGILQMIGEYTGNIGIDSKSGCWVYPVTVYREYQRWQDSIHRVYRAKEDST